MTGLSLLAADTGVSAGVIDVAGWAVGLGGLALTALWLTYLYR